MNRWMGGLLGLGLACVVGCGSDPVEDCEDFVAAFCSDEIDDCGVPVQRNECNPMAVLGRSCSGTIGVGSNFGDCLDALDAPGCLDQASFEAACRNALEFE